jgi:asparagine synthase (glutamine-hydrolysing)
VDDQQCIRVRREHMPEPLSSTLVSSVVEVTPRRLLMPTGGRVTAFTAVPRPGYDGAAPRGRIIDEGPLAAQIAALYTKR